jgi:flagellar protein FlbD
LAGCFYVRHQQCGGNRMIEVTKLNGTKILINPDLMELVEETPDTVITFTTGRKIIVKESRQEIRNLVKSYRKDIFVN